MRGAPRVWFSSPLVASLLAAAPVEAGAVLFYGASFPFVLGFPVSCLLGCRGRYISLRVGLR